MDSRDLLSPSPADVWTVEEDNGLLRGSDSVTGFGDTLL